jgi:hypothetical protein
MTKVRQKCRRPDKVGKRPESDMMLQVWYVREVFRFKLEVTRYGVIESLKSIVVTMKW